MLYGHIKESTDLLQRMRWGHRLLDATETTEQESRQTKSTRGRAKKTQFDDASGDDVPQLAFSEREIDWSNPLSCQLELQVSWVSRVLSLAPIWRRRTPNPCPAPGPAPPPLSPGHLP